MRAEFAVLRAPVLPLSDWWEGDERSLPEWLGRPEVRTALAVASPSLLAQLARGGDGGSGLDPKLRRALWRYRARMCSRSMPFGLFATVTTGVIGERTVIELAPLAATRRVSHLDVGLLAAVGDAVANDPRYSASIAYRPNDTIHKAAGRLRCTGWREQGERRVYESVSIRATRAAEAALDRAQGGATRAQIAEAVARLGHAEGSAQRLVAALIERKLLIHALHPIVTREEPGRALAGALRRHGAYAPAAAVEAACDALDAVDEAGITGDPELARQLAARIEALPVPSPTGTPYISDAIRPAVSFSVGPAVIDELRTGLALMTRLHPPSAVDRLAAFRQAFRERYGLREVPLLEAADLEHGVGSSLRHDPADGRPAVAPDRVAALHELIVRAERVGGLEVELDDELITSLAVAEPPPSLPDALAAHVTVLAKSGGAVDRGEFRLLVHSFSGLSGTLLLGRLTGADPDLRDAVRSFLQVEEGLDPEAVFAEVVHLPHGGDANLVRRAAVREHEIQVVSGSGAAPEARLPLSDLLISLDGDAFTVRSGSLDRRVLPCFASALSIEREMPPACRFLVALAHDRGPRLWFDWWPLQAARFRPRLRAGRLILQAASWRVSRSEVARLTTAASAGDARREVDRWRSERRLPRRIAIVDIDRSLPIDLERGIDVDVLLSELARHVSGATLTEVMPEPDDLWVRGPEGGYAHELVLPLVREAPARLSARRHTRRRRESARLTGPRTFPPGSEWLFAQVYCQPEASDRILLDVLAPLVDRMRVQGVVSGWFFIRYTDPLPHLRIRLRGSPDELLAHALPALRDAVAPLLDRSIRRLALDTYEREIERYGGPDGIEICERIFEADSDFVVAALRSSRDADRRRHLAVASTDLVLAACGLAVEDRLEAVTRARDSLWARSGTTETPAALFAAAFREERRQLEALLATARSAARDGPAEARWREAMRREAARLAQLSAQRRLDLPLEAIAGSLAHMHCNRMLRSLSPLEEARINDALMQLYRGELARAG